MRRGAVVAFTAALSYGATLAHAQRAAPPTKPETTASPLPARPARAGLEDLAHALALALGPVPKGARVVGAPLKTDADTPRKDALVARFVSRLGSALGGAAPVDKPATLAEARAAAGHAAAVVFVELEIVKGELRATADVHAPQANVWDRLRQSAPPPSAHAYAAAPIDAEIRSFMTPVLLERAQVRRAKHAEGAEVVAIGCGDVDGDGGLELVLVSRAAVTLGKVVGDRFVVTRQAPWPRLAARAAVPLREPIASVLMSPKGHAGEIWLGTTDRHGVVVDGSLTARRALAGIPIAGADACALPLAEAGALDGALVACEADPKAAGRSPDVVVHLPETRFDAGGSLTLVSATGAPARVAFARAPAGTLRFGAEGTTSTRTLEGAGAEVALGDLDLDGRAELAFSAGGGDETVTIATVTATGFETRLRIRADEPVRALAICPPEERGVPVLAVAFATEVWLVR